MVRFRLALIKYGYISVIQWDPTKNRCVICGNYAFWNGYLLCVFGTAITTFFSAHLFIKIQTSDEMEDVDDGNLESRNRYRELGSLVMIMGVMLVALMLSLVYLVIEKKVEASAFYNACFQLDTKLKGL